MSTGLSKGLSIFSINVNGFNCPLKRHRLAHWIQKLKPDICCIQELHLTLKDKYRLKVKGWSSILQTNGKQKKAGIAILFPDAIGFKPTKIRMDTSYLLKVILNMMRFQLLIFMHPTRMCLNL